MMPNTLFKNIKDKLILCCLTTVLLIACAILGAKTISDRQQHRIPYISLYSDNSYVKAIPRFYCAIDLQNCNPSNARVRFPVKPGSTLMISIPEEITYRPWAYQQYVMINGKTTEQLVLQKPGKSTTIILHTRKNKPLIAFTVLALASILDVDGQPQVNAEWLVDTRSLRN